MTPRRLRLGSRGSRLALVQARLAAKALAGAVGGPIEVVIVRTRGDELSRHRPRGSWETTDGQFTAEIERQLLAGDLDLAVHSLKDLPTISSPGLAIGAILERDDPRDCLVTGDDRPWRELPYGARIGTSSARRAAQLAAMRPDLVAMPIRGNVETRIARARQGEYDAVLLAAAGIDRLGIAIPDAARLDLDLVLPAAGQGAIAVQCRADDPLLGLLATADHAPTHAAVDAERALLRGLGGGCLAPLGVHASVVAGQLELRAAWEDGDGLLRRARETGPVGEAAAVVERVRIALLADVAIVGLPA